MKNSRELNVPDQLLLIKYRKKIVLLSTLPNNSSGYQKNQGRLSGASYPVQSQYPVKYAFTCY